MRKFLIISLTMLYLALSVGVQVYKHYCCGKLKEVSFTGSSEHCCGHTSGCSLGHGCCDFETITFKIDDEHKDSERLVFHAAEEFLVPDFCLSSFIPLNESDKPAAGNGNDPPPVTDKYSLFCARIVYG